jgi:hypothetical protein
MFAGIEATAKDFSTWISQKLPTRNRNLVEKHEKQQSGFYYTMKRYFEVRSEFIYSFYFGKYQEYITYNPGARLSILFFIPRATYLYGGINTTFYLLDTKNTYADSLDILMGSIPFTISFGCNFHLFKYLELDFSTGAGISLNGGYLMNSTALYVRPVISVDTLVIFTPVRYFKLGLGLLFTTTFNSYQDWIMPAFSPRFSLSVSF